MLYRCRKVRKVHVHLLAAINERLSQLRLRLTVRASAKSFSSFAPVIASSSTFKRDEGDFLIASAVSTFPDCYQRFSQIVKNRSLTDLLFCMSIVVQLSYNYEDFEDQSNLTLRDEEFNVF